MSDAAVDQEGEIGLVVPGPTEREQRSAAGLAVQERSPTAGLVSYDRYRQVAADIARTEFVPKGLRGRPDAVLACILAGSEMGIGPMHALKHINIIDGKPSPSAELLNSLVRERGHLLTPIVYTDQEVTVKGVRADTGEEHSVTWTLEQARNIQAGSKKLADKDNWRSYPRAMLWARAVSELCRILFPDCTGGMTHTPDELGAVTDEEGHVIEAEVVEAQPQTAAGEGTPADPAAALPDWLTEWVDIYGEGEVIDATDAIREEKGLAPCNGLSSVALATEETREQILAILREQSEPAADSSEPATEEMEAPAPESVGEGGAEPALPDFLSMIQDARDAGIIDFNDVAKAATLAVAHVEGFTSTPRGWKQVEDIPSDALRFMVESLNLKERLA